MGDLVVVTGHERRQRLCGGDDPFMQIRNVGCGAGRPVIIPFAAGDRPYNDGVIRGKVTVESKDSGPQIDVLRVRLTYGMVDGGEAKTAAGAPAENVGG